MVTNANPTGPVPLVGVDPDTAANGEPATSVRVVLLTENTEMVPGVGGVMTAPGFATNKKVPAGLKANATGDTRPPCGVLADANVPSEFTVKGSI